MTTVATLPIRAPRRLPDGFTVRIARAVLRVGGGSVLLGGSPLTAMRLSPHAQMLLSEDQVTVQGAAGAHLADRLLATNLGQPDLSSRPPERAAELTVVIPVRDRADQLDRALAGLAGLKCVVVDDASRDRVAVAEVVARHRAEYLPLDHNVGPGAARNVGLARVETPFVAFVDCDVQVAAGDLLLLARHFADPAVTLVGPRIVGSTEGRASWFQAYDARSSSLTVGTAPASVRVGSTVGWLPSACLVGRTAALTGGFDVSLRVAEDVDLVWRQLGAGHRVRYDPGVTARHETRATLRSWLGRTYYYGTGSALLGARHGKAVAPAILTPTYAAAGAAILTRRWPAVPLAALALGIGMRKVAAGLPEASDTRAVAARISLRGLGWSVRQESALLLKHWWPAAAVGAVVSSDVRRALATALVVDAIVQHSEGVPVTPTNVLARRLSDLAYGAGLWTGAARSRSSTALEPRRP